MKLTAQLAYSQIKINRSLTRWTLLGVILSTTLLTAICNLVASALSTKIIISGYVLVVDNVAEIVAAIWPLAIALGFLVMVMSVIVISNAFWVSAAERTGQFGILKSVGATKRQITATIMYESVFISAVGIPIGTICGLGLAYAGLLVADNSIGEINRLTRLMVQEFAIELQFRISWLAVSFAILFSFVTILIAAWRPARKAARNAAIDSINSTGEVKVDHRKKPINPLFYKIIGCEGALAAQNIKRRRRNFRAGIISMTISIILFVNIGSLSHQINLAENYMFNEAIGNPIVVNYTSNMTEVDNPLTAKIERTIDAPIDNRTADAVTTRLREYDGAVVLGIGTDLESYEAVIPDRLITQKMLKIIGAESGDNKRLSVEILTTDPQNYTHLCELANVPEGSNILLNQYNYNDDGQLISMTPFLYRGQPEETITLIKNDESMQEIAIQGILTTEEIPAELIVPAMNQVRILVPQNDNRGYTWYVDAVDRSGFMTYAEVVTLELFPENYLGSYMESGFNVRVYEFRDYIKVINLPIFIAKVFLYSFILMLLIIGLTNVISTMSANVRMRSREFAVLQSVGMTHDGLNRMLNMESILSSSKMLLYGLPLAVGLTYVINIPIRKLFPLPWQFPWLEVLICAIFVTLISWLTMRYSASLLRNKNIIETIRSENPLTK